MVAGCWVHAKRKYAELVKSTGIPQLERTVAAQDVKLISELFHLDGLYDKSKDKDWKDYRQREVAPKVDAYFAWVTESRSKVPAGGSTYKALQYMISLLIFFPGPKPRKKCSSLRKVSKKV